MCIFFNMYDTIEPLIVQRCQMEKWRKKYERFCSILVSSSIVACHEKWTGWEIHAPPPRPYIKNSTVLKGLTNALTLEQGLFFRRSEVLVKQGKIEKHKQTQIMTFRKKINRQKDGQSDKYISLGISAPEKIMLEMYYYFCFWSYLIRESAKKTVFFSG